MTNSYGPSVYPLEKPLDDTERNESTGIYSEGENIVGFDPLVDCRPGKQFGIEA